MLQRMVEREGPGEYRILIEGISVVGKESGVVKVWPIASSQLKKGWVTVCSKLFSCCS